MVILYGVRFFKSYRLYNSLSNTARLLHIGIACMGFLAS
nr:MAG TPA: hypothetical protein [Bacteriophage sp.]